MKYIILILIFLGCFHNLFAQKHNSNKQLNPKTSSTIKRGSQTKKCFLHATEVIKDSVVYVTQNLLEYGYEDNKARILITTYDYDLVKEKLAKLNGSSLTKLETIQFVDGTYKIEKNLLTFKPDDAINFKTTQFKISFKPKSSTIQFLTNKTGEKYVKGECYVDSPSLGKL